MTKAIFTEDPTWRPEVRLHEYVDIFASLANPQHLPFPPAPGDAARRKKRLRRERTREAEHRSGGRAREGSHLPGRSVTLGEDRVRPRRYSPLVPPPEGAVGRAKAMLSQHFLVGVTEDLSSFLALVSLEMNWPPHAMCLPYPCQLKHGSGAYACATAGSL